MLVVFYENFSEIGLSFVVGGSKLTFFVGQILNLELHLFWDGGSRNIEIFFFNFLIIKLLCLGTYTRRSLIFS